MRTAIVRRAPGPPMPELSLTVGGLAHRCQRRCLLIMFSNTRHGWASIAFILYKRPARHRNWRLMAAVRSICSGNVLDMRWAQVCRTQESVASAMRIPVLCALSMASS